MLIHIETWLEEQRDRLALWVPVFLALGVGAWFALPAPVSWVAWICGCSVAALCSLLLPAGGRLRYAIVAACLLAAAGCVLIWAKAEIWGEKPLSYPTFTQVQGKVVSVEFQPTLDRVRVVVTPDSEQQNLPRKIRVTISQKHWQENMGKGAVIAFRSRLMPPASAAVPGAYDFASRAYFMGIGATGSALHPVNVVVPAHKNRGDIRQRLSLHIQQQISGGAGAIAATLVTGDRGAIPSEDEQAMRRSGLAHLLSISGLHVSALIGAVIFLTYRALSLSRWLALRMPLPLLAACAGASAGLGYTVLTGAEVPTIRSCVAALLVLGGLALGREAMSLRLVAAGCTIILLLWPEALVGPSFQMSFMAVAVIVGLMEASWFRRLTLTRDEPWHKKILRTLASLFITGVAIELALMPIALHHFHQAGLLGAVANLVAIPLTTFVVMPAEALALLADSVGMGAPFWWVTEKALSLMLLVAYAVSNHPWSVWPLPVTSITPFVIAMLGLTWLMIWQGPVCLLGGIAAFGALAMMIVTPAPDILVSNDGRHMLIRQEDGSLAILRGNAGAYVRGMLGSAVGDGEDFAGSYRMIPLTESRFAKCSPELCFVRVQAGKDGDTEPWTILATRNDIQVPWRAFIEACRNVDIVVSDRNLPKACTPRRTKLDRGSLERTGGVAIYLRSGQWRVTNKPKDQHPWIVR